MRREITGDKLRLCNLSCNQFSNQGFFSSPVSNLTTLFSRHYNPLRTGSLHTKPISLCISVSPPKLRMFPGHVRTDSCQANRRIPYLPRVSPFPNLWTFSVFSQRHLSLIPFVGVAQLRQIRLRHGTPKGVLSPSHCQAGFFHRSGHNLVESVSLRGVRSANNSNHNSVNRFR